MGASLHEDGEPHDAPFHRQEAQALNGKVYNKESDKQQIKDIVVSASDADKVEPWRVPVHRENANRL